MLDGEAIDGEAMRDSKVGGVKVEGEVKPHLGASVLEIFEGGLDTFGLYRKYENLAREKNCGACCVFCGVVRGEEFGGDLSGVLGGFGKQDFEARSFDGGKSHAGLEDSKPSENLETQGGGNPASVGGDSSQGDSREIEGLSFDIYESLLKGWFARWEERLGGRAILCMAHSRGDVMVGESSFMCAIISPQRRVALEYYEAFIEDFKHRAPIWKYDLVAGRRIYASARSHALPSSGLLG